MAIALCRDGIFACFDHAMHHATLPIWRAACASWEDSPPLHTQAARWLGIKPRRKRGPNGPIDMSVLDRPLDPNVVAALRGEPVTGSVSVAEFMAQQRG